jgi:nitroreductase
MAMNDTLKSIYERRAVRKYKEQPVDNKLIDEIIAAGRMAPSALNQQVWKFYVVTDAEEIKRLSFSIAQVAENYFHLSHGIDISKVDDLIFHHAPVVIFITAPKNNDWGSLDVGMCSQNMMLAARSLGLDSCPIGFATFLHMTDKLSELGISNAEQIQLAIIFGYADEKPELHERKTDNVKFITAKSNKYIVLA